MRIHSLYPLSACLLLASLFFATTGCRTTVQRGAITRKEPLTTALDIDDVRQVTDVMLDDMLAAPAVVDIIQASIESHGGQGRPILVLGPIFNKTRSRLNVHILANKLRARMISSGLFQILDRRSDHAIVGEMAYQREAGVSSQENLPESGQQMNPAYQLHTELLELRTEKGRVRDVTYSIRMELLHLQTGYTVWIHEMEIGKSQKRALLGI